METDENEGVQGKEMPKDATLKTDLFLLKSKGAAIKCDLVEQIKYNVTGEFCTVPQYDDLNSFFTHIVVLTNRCHP